MQSDRCRAELEQAQRALAQSAEIIARYRRALEHYADDSNWDIVSFHLNPTVRANLRLYRPDQHPPFVAQRALDGVDE